MYCVIAVRSIAIECWSLKPSCVGDRGLCCVNELRIGLLRIMTGLHKNEIELFDVGSVGSFFNFSIGMVLDFFRYVRCRALLCGLTSFGFQPYTF